MLRRLIILAFVLMVTLSAVNAGHGGYHDGIQISAPYGYDAAPAIYQLEDDTINICVDYTNNGKSTVKINPHAYFFTLTTSNGVDVTSGFPAMGEWQLANNVWDYHEPQVLRDVVWKSAVYLSSGETESVCWNYDPNYTGYYQIDFAATSAPGLGAWAFARVIDDSINEQYNTPPHIDVPDQVAIVNEPMKSIDLRYFASDNEQQDSELIFTLLENTHSEIVGATIVHDRFLAFGVPQQVGSTQIKLQVSDGDLTSEDTFMVTVLDENGSNNLPPVAIIQLEPGNTGMEPFNVEFDGSFSYDLDGQILFYFWSFGDGDVWFGEDVQHEYEAEGIYQATLTVFDNDLASDSATVWINVQDDSNLHQCEDSLDNDGDGLIDYPNDPGCSNPHDDDEYNDDPLNYACSDNLDNDGDGLIDYPQDPGCYGPTDDNEYNDNSLNYACSDNLDNDGDGLIDYPNDPGCYSEIDDDEYNYVPQCSDGIDNDGDGIIDYPNDPGCEDSYDNDEQNSVYQCSDSLDNDNDGLIDYPLDPGCTSPIDNSEIDINDEIIHGCEDGIDNDGDGLIDMQDPGCEDVNDNTEEDIIYSDSEEFHIRAIDYFQDYDELKIFVKLENTGHMDQVIELETNNLHNSLRKTTTVRLAPHAIVWKEVIFDLNEDYEDYGFDVFRVTATNNRYISLSLYSNVYIYDFRG